MGRGESFCVGRRGKRAWGIVNKPDGGRRGEGTVLKVGVWRWAKARLIGSGTESEGEMHGRVLVEGGCCGV